MFAFSFCQKLVYIIAATNYVNFSNRLCKPKGDRLCKPNICFVGPCAGAVGRTLVYIITLQIFVRRTGVRVSRGTSQNRSGLHNNLTRTNVCINGSNPTAARGSAELLEPQAIAAAKTFKKSIDFFIKR